MRPANVFGLDLASTGDNGLLDRPAFAIFCFVVLGGCAVMVANLRRSSTGRRLLAVRSNERAAAAVGVGVPRTKLLAFAIASGIAGIGGVMQGFKQNDVSSAGLVYQASLTYLAFAYLGGITSASIADPGRHSGVCRILRMRMRPLAFAEQGYESSVSLAALLTGRRPAIAGETSVDLKTYTAEIVASGFPGVRELPGRTRRAQLDSYIERVVDRDIAELGTKVRNPSAMKRWMSAYAAATATTTTYAKIAGAANPETREQTSRTTLTAYRDALERLFILDALPGWMPNNAHLGELAASPKHHLADPALAVALLGLDENAMLAGDDRGGTGFRDGPFLGALFESLVALG